MMKTSRRSECDVALWDHKSLGRPITLHFADDCVNIMLEISLLQEAAHIMDTSYGDKILCFITAALNQDKSSPGKLNLVFNKISEIGAYQQEKNSLLFPVYLYRRTRGEVELSVEEYINIMSDLLENFSCETVNIAKVFMLHISCTIQDRHCRINVEVITYATKLTLCTIETVLVGACDFMDHLMAQVNSGIKCSGFIIKYANQLHLIEEKHHDATNAPIVGIWVHGVSNIHHPLVWAAGIRYIYSPKYTNRLCIPPLPFLVLLYNSDSLLPTCYDCVVPFGADKPKYLLQQGSFSSSLPKVPMAKRFVRIQLKRSKNARISKAAGKMKQMKLPLPKEEVIIDNIEDIPQLPPVPLKQKIILGEVSDISTISDLDTERSTEYQFSKLHLNKDFSKHHNSNPPAESFSSKSVGLGVQEIKKDFIKSDNFHVPSERISMLKTDQLDMHPSSVDGFMKRVELTDDSAFKRFDEYQWGRGGLFKASESNSNSKEKLHSTSTSKCSMNAQQFSHEENRKRMSATSMLLGGPLPKNNTVPPETSEGIDNFALLQPYDCTNFSRNVNEYLNNQIKNIIHIQSQMCNSLQQQFEAVKDRNSQFMCHEDLLCNENFNDYFLAVSQKILDEMKTSNNKIHLKKVLEQNVTLVNNLMDQNLHMQSFVNHTISRLEDLKKEILECLKRIDTKEKSVFTETAERSSDLSSHCQSKGIEKKRVANASTITSNTFNEDDHTTQIKKSRTATESENFKHFVSSHSQTDNQIAKTRNIGTITSSVVGYSQSKPQSRKHHKKSSTESSTDSITSSITSIDKSKNMRDASCMTSQFLERSSVPDINKSKVICSGSKVLNLQFCDKSKKSKVCNASTMTDDLIKMTETVPHSCGDMPEQFSSSTMISDISEFEDLIHSKLSSLIADNSGNEISESHSSQQKLKVNKKSCQTEEHTKGLFCSSFKMKSASEESQSDSFSRSALSLNVEKSQHSPNISETNNFKKNDFTRFANSKDSLDLVLKTGKNQEKKHIKEDEGKKDFKRPKACCSELCLFSKKELLKKSDAVAGPSSPERRFYEALKDLDCGESIFPRHSSPLLIPKRQEKKQLKTTGHLKDSSLLKMDDDSEDSMEEKVEEVPHSHSSISIFGLSSPNLSFDTRNYLISHGLTSFNRKSESKEKKRSKRS